MFYKILVLSIVFLSIFASCSKDKTTEPINPTPNNSTTVTISTQVWMAKNLDVDHYRNGDPIPQILDSIQWAKLKTGAYCYYNNDPSMGAINGNIYGKLYNWYAVNDPRGLAPKGWHIPSFDEWYTLEFYLGGRDIAGGKLKESGKAHWQSPNACATNESGFSALPGGRRRALGLDIYNMYMQIGEIGYMWYSDELDSLDGGGWQLYYNGCTSGGCNFSKESGLSVRCVHD